MYDDSSDKKETLLHKALEGAAAERVSRFGNAVKQHTLQLPIMEENDLKS